MPGSSFIALSAQPVEYHLRVRDALAELVVDEARMPGRDGDSCPLLCFSMRERPEAAAFERSRLDLLRPVV